MRLIASLLQHTTEQLISFFRSQTDWQVPVWRQGRMRGMNLISTISTLSIYSNMMTSHEFIPTWPLSKVSMSDMSGDRNKYGRAHISLIACSFVSINTLDKMRAGALIVRLFIMTRQASYPMTGREADRSLPRRMYYILWARSSSSSYSARGTPTRDPDSSQQVSKPIPYLIRVGSDAFLKFTILRY